MMSRQMTEARHFLMQKYSVTVPDEWLTACVDYVMETPDLADDVNQNVYLQWLHSDLYQLEQPCLPRELLTRDNYTLSGKFCVQINSYRDVAQPAYAQLQRFRGRELDEADEPSSDWKKRKEVPRRMLRMELTDGIINVPAIEYQPIPNLNVEMLSPGCKAQLRGQIICKRGTGMANNSSCMLFLSAENIAILGGTVEALTEQNEVVTLLERHLETCAKQSKLPAGKKPPQSNRADATNSNRSGPNNGRSTGNNATQQKPMSTSSVAPAPKKMPAPPQPKQQTVNVNINSKPAEQMQNRTQPTVNKVPPYDINVSNAAAATARNRYAPTPRDNNYENDFEEASGQTITTVVGGQSGRSQLSNQTMRIRNSTQNTAITAPLTGTTINGSINPSSTDRSQFQSGPHDVINASYEMEDEDDENILKAIASVEEESSFAIDFDAYGGTEFDFSAPTVDNNKPFSYLSSVINDSTVSRFVIKGFVLATVGKLEFSSSNNGLSLKVRIADSSAAIECVIAQDIVSSFLGFSAAEAKRLHSLASVNKDVSASKRLSEGVARCKYRLASLSGLLTIERSLSIPSPQFELVNVADPTMEDCKLLLARVDAKLRI